jgi:hypothetical protein
MQTVTIGQFITDWTSGAKLYGYPADEDTVLYRIGDGSICLYIGITLRGVNQRLREHLGLDYKAPSPIGELINQMRPESTRWPVDLFTTKELRTLLRRQWRDRNVEHWSERSIAREAEITMILRDRPCLNYHNNLNPRPLPKRYFR